MLAAEIVTSYIGGLSVIEIARVLGQSPGQVHDLLRSAKAIEPITRQHRPPSYIFTNHVLYDAFKKRNYSIERWAQGWGFEMEDVFYVLKNPTQDEVIQSPSDVVKALGRDMPRAYEAVFKSKPISLKLKRNIAFPPEYKITWDDVGKSFIATIVTDDPSSDFAKLCGIASTRSRSLEILEHHEKTCRQILKLREAVAVIQSWN